MKLIAHIGKYFLMLGTIFSKPEKMSVFRKRLFEEIQKIGVSSIMIVALMSVFIGGVIALQTASNMGNPLLPAYTVGYITRSSTILELSPTIISLILAGKVGSNIASEIGTMRITEQIDALEIMGVNSLSYIVLPKIVAALLFFPILIIFSMALALIGGWLSLLLTGLTDTGTYLLGIRAFFLPYEVFYALTKTVFFGFVIVSISSYYGYYAKGGSVEVGKSSTEAVVTSSICVLIVNFIITQIMLL
ncbi:MAG TPA: ABC transporter permease [Crocinitomicaceae bacterium]|nr:ABC transporter permease [Crocinitomicaceae bacterium]